MTSSASARPPRALVALFAIATFLNAALLFAVEPMFTKMVLPLLGGTPSVWNTCLLFFQGMLLVGYLYAHLTTRWLSPPRQAALHLALLVASLAILPIAISSDAAPPAAARFPIFWLLGLLTVTLGLPFLLLSAGAPMLQRWFATTRDPSASNPYFLYVASNLGSFGALIAYPLLVEPRLPLSDQRVVWLDWYYGLMAMILVAAIATWWWRRDDTGGVRLVTENPADAHRFDTGGAPATPTSSAKPRDAVPALPALANDRGEASDRLDVASPTPNARTARTLDAANHLANDDTLAAAPTIIPTRAWRLRWVLLSFAPSSLLLGVTTFISTDIASVPFLWIVPLALYLLTFVIVFARRPIFGRRFMLFFQLVVGLTLMVIISASPGGKLTQIALLHLIAFFATALVLHRELADSRPKAEYLTEFYLWMSLGGVLGGLFNVVLAPLLYDRVLEYPYAMIIAFGLRPGARDARYDRRSLLFDVVFPLTLLAAIITGYGLPDLPGKLGEWGVYVYLVVAALIAASFYRRPLRLALGAAAIWFGVDFATRGAQENLLQTRSFFGVYKVRRWGEYVMLQHGTTTHGGQSVLAARREEPLTYYHREGPLGDIFGLATDPELPRSVALVGLGSGTTACYARPGERWTYYEIDPVMVRIARSSGLFSYLHDCQPDVQIVLGDARLSIAAARDSSFDLIVLDAFSSDAIPVHLITREALRLYTRKLRPNGVIAFHISNRYLNLSPVLIELARDARLAGAIVDRNVTEPQRLKLYYGSRWVALARQARTLAPLVREANWDVLDPSANARLWTDDYSDVLGVMKWK